MPIARLVRHERLDITMKSCPYCAQLIEENLSVCRYCGRDAADGAQPTVPGSRVPGATVPDSTLDHNLKPGTRNLQPQIRETEMIGAAVNASAARTPNWKLPALAAAATLVGFF